MDLDGVKRLYSVDQFKALESNDGMYCLSPGFGHCSMTVLSSDSQFDHLDPLQNYLISSHHITNESVEKLQNSKIWLYVDSTFDVEYCLLRKLVFLSINLYITEPNDCLRVLMTNCQEILVGEKSLIRYVRQIYKQTTQLYMHHEYIISPLNPLADNLPISVYEQFRKDRYKYDQYEKAISMAIDDLKLKYDNIKLLIIGPGMGDLVDRTVIFCSHLTVIEKNRNVIEYLRERNKTLWKGQVNVIEGDARNLDVSGYHLVISEMLGSFGCNELFPEVLQTITAEVMIPSYVETNIVPIYSKIMHTEPFLNNLRLYYPLAEPQTVWLYSYPGDNCLNRTSTLEFEVKIDGEINAIKGVFNANLYGNYNITNEKNKDLCNSWFPIVFPINRIEVKRGDTLTVKFSRYSEKQVWYEWEVNGVKYNTHGSTSIRM